MYQMHRQLWGVCVYHIVLFHQASDPHGAFTLITCVWVLCAYGFHMMVCVHSKVWRLRLPQWFVGKSELGKKVMGVKSGVDLDCVVMVAT